MDNSFLCAHYTNIALLFLIGEPTRLGDEKRKGNKQRDQDSRGIRSHIRDSPPTLRHVVVDGSLTRSRKLEEGKTSARWTAKMQDEANERTRARK